MIDLSKERRGSFQRIKDEYTHELLVQTGRFYTRNTRSWIRNDYVFFIGKKRYRKGNYFLGFGRIYGIYTDFETSLKEEQYFKLNNYKWAIQVDRLTLFKEPIPIKKIDLDEIKTAYYRRKPILDEEDMDFLFEFIEGSIHRKPYQKY